jgi:hypothetical protein
MPIDELEHDVRVIAETSLLLYWTVQCRHHVDTTSYSWRSVAIGPAHIAVPPIVTQVLIHWTDAQYMLAEETHGKNEETCLRDWIPCNDAKHCLCGRHLGTFRQEIHAILFFPPFVVHSATATIVLPGMKKYHDRMPCVCNVGGHECTEPTKPQNVTHLLMP